MISRIAYFLSGHGFGHGVRNSAVMEALPPEVEISIFTPLPESFFREELRRPFRHIPCEIDCGSLQTSTVEVDVKATLERYAFLESRRDEAMGRFVPLLQSLRADLVVGDIPPLAFPIAKAAGVPAWAQFNFTWLDIYRPYVERFPQYRDMLRRMEADYALADRSLRLYPSLDGGMPGNVDDVGMLCRPGKERRAEFAQRFGLDPDKKWALVYVGSFGLDGVAWDRLADFRDWEFMGLYPLQGAPGNYRHLIKDASFRYADLTASCDLVIGKLGYGLIAECMASAKPILFMGRTDFEEYPMLKKTVEANGMGRELPLADFKRMDLGEALQDMAGRRLEPKKADGLGRILEKMGFSPSRT